MIQQVDDSRRLVVPRWRPFRVAAGLGLLDSPGKPPVPKPSSGELEEVQADWRRHRSPFHAANLVDLAVVLNRPEIATDAAVFIASSGNSALPEFELARFVLSNMDRPISATPPDLSPSTRFRRIAEARRSLRRQPRNPILIVDLARDYSSLGQKDPAERALQRAVLFAPHSRFVLRAASRFFLHAGRPDEAHAVVRRVHKAKADPWLLAAEIVAAAAAGRDSRWINLARELIDGGAFEPSHITELASALGTIEHANGNIRGVKRLFKHALVEPTENSVAQAAWVSRHMSSFEVPESSLTVPRAFEAKAWSAAIGQRYETAVELSWAWLRDEPFATRAALFGAGVASVALGDFQTGAELASIARLANRDDPRLIVELIYCLASQDKIDDAESLLLTDLPRAVSRRPGIMSDVSLRVIETADHGLIAFRRGDFPNGRRFYERAILFAREAGSDVLAASALLHFLREEARANLTADLPWEQARQALKAFPPNTRPFYERFLGRIPTLRAGSR